MTYDEVFEALRSHGGVLRRRDHPALRHQLHHLVRTGRMVAIYPGIYCLPSERTNPQVRLRGAIAWHPDGVLMGVAAATLTFMPKLKLGEIVMATRRKRIAPPGIRLVRWNLPEELIVERDGVRLTVPALTAIDLSLRDDGAAIDEVLRLGMATLEQMWSALRQSKFRLGNPRRRELLLDSRDLPWSPAERRAHRIFRDDGITGWISNLAVNLSGKRTLLDIAFEEWRVALEVDGFEFHGQGMSIESRRQFEHDRWKGTELAADGWIVLRVTWWQLTEDAPWVLRMVRKALTARGWSPRIVESLAA